MNNEKPAGKVLIVGCGDIGRRLARELSGDSWTLTGLRRQPPAEQDPHLEYVAADATDPQALVRALAPGHDVIVLTMTPGERSDEGYHQAYVRTCENLLAGLRQRSQQQEQTPRLILFVSSTGVYGQDDGSLVDENSSTEPQGFSGRRLLEAEQLLRNSGLPHCIVRFSGIYGPGRRRLIEQVRSGRAALSRHWTNRIHADDCAGFLAHLIRLNADGQTLAPVYIGSDSEPAPMAEVVGWLTTKLGVDRARFAPDDPDSRAGNKRCSNARMLATGYRLRYPGYREGYGALEDWQ